MPQSPNKIIQFWQELKRRKVIKVVAMYAATAFILLELVDIVAPSLGLPDWTLNLVIVLLSVGFPIAIILSWIFDVTPEGIKKTESVEEISVQEPSPSSGKRRLKASDIIIAVLFVVVCVMLYPKIFKTENFEAVLDKEGRLAIAVLPFRNISPDSSNQYVLDGIMEAVLNYLTKVENVRVITSISVQQYRETYKSITQIGEELNVNYILEGNGQKYDNDFRLSIKLSDIKNNTLVMSNPYNREINDILDLQSEIAQKIVSELKMELSNEAQENLSERPTFSEKAYSKYLEAKRSNLSEAIDLLEEAIEIDPLFVEAYLQMAHEYIRRTYIGRGELSSTEALKLALPLNKKALEINPDHLGARLQLGYIKFMLAWDFKGAEKEFLKANKIGDRPVNYISLLIQNKRYVEALELGVRLRNYDPVTADYEMMLTYLFLGEYQKALKLSGGGGWAARIYMLMHDYDKAIAELENTYEFRRIPFFLSDLAICYYVTGEKESAKELLQEFIERYKQGEQGSIAFAIARYYSGIDEIEPALEWLEKSYQDHEMEMIWLYADPAFESLQDNEQYIDLLRRVGFDV